MIYRNLVFSLFVLLLVFGCKNDDKFKVPDDLTEGAIPLLTLKTDSIINYSDLQSINKVFTIDLKGTARQINIVAKRNNKQSYLYQEVSQWPTDIAVNYNKLVSVFGGEIKEEKDIKINDIFQFSADVILSDGTVLKGNTFENYSGYSPGLLLEAGKPPFIRFKVSCPSNLAGKYNTNSSGTSTDMDTEQNPLNDFKSSVIITSLGGGQYSISDVFCGVYQLWYGKYGYTVETQGIIKDECGTLSGTWKDLFGNNIVFSGKVDINGKISGHWENDYGDKVDVVMVKE